MAYWAITAAMRVGEVSAVAPFRYTRLLFALVIAALAFGERPDALTLLGAAIVIASGLYMFLRERRMARPALTPMEPAP
jgi:drug/metabolite transporter (DMT)-like permease